MSNYFLYIIKSFFRRFHMHAGFIVMLSCAFVLPFIFTIVLDSANYGTYMQSIHITKGCDFRIENAKESDLVFYKDIKGIQVSFDSGTIFINANTKLDENNRDEFATLLFNKTMEVGNGRLSFINSTFDTSTQKKFAAQWVVVTVILIAISMLIIQVAYSTHVGNFKTEIGILEAIGASQKQIKKIFFAELSICFGIAVIMAFIFAYSGTFILFKFFLQIDTSETMSWIIFHIEPIHVISLLGILMLFMVAVFWIKFNKVIQSTTVSLLSSTMNDDRLKHYRSTFKKFQNPVRVLSRILLQRSNIVFLQTLTISIPIVIVTVFILNYSIIYMDTLNQKPEYDVVIHKYPDISSNENINFGSGFSTEEIDYVKSMPEISNAEFEVDMMEGDYLIGISDETTGDLQYPFITIDGDNYLLVKVHALSDLSHEYVELITGNKGDMDDEMHIAISKNYAFAKYAIGEEIYLYKRNSTDDNFDQVDENDNVVENAHNSFLEPIKLKVTNLLDTPYSEEAISIYFNDDDFNELTNGSSTNIIQIKLNYNVDDVSFSKKLSAYFNDPELYEITNVSEKVRIKSRTSIGVFILMEVVLGMISIFMLITLFLLLSEYIRRQTKNVETLFVLGASKQAIIKIYMRQATVIVTASLTVSVGIGMLLSTAFFYDSGYNLLATPFVLLSYAVVIGIVLLAFMLPVFLGLKKQLRKL